MRWDWMGLGGVDKGGGALREGKLGYVGVGMWGCGGMWGVLGMSGNRARMEVGLGMPEGGRICLVSLVYLVSQVSRKSGKSVR